MTGDLPGNLIQSYTQLAIQTLQIFFDNLKNS